MSKVEEWLLMRQREAEARRQIQELEDAAILARLEMLAELQNPELASLSKELKELHATDTEPEVHPRSGDSVLPKKRG